MTERDLGTYQMLWNCPSCGSEKLLGLEHRHCPNCGSAQDPTKRYFPSDADRVLVRDHRFTGSDRLCPACESPAAAIAHNCANCGSPLDGAKAVKLLDEHGVVAKKVASPAPPPPKSGRGKFIAIAVVLTILAFIVVAVTWKKPVDLEVVGHEWERTISIEEYRRLSESAWRDQVPSGAQSVSCRREKRSTKQVANGQTCTTKKKDNGDGTYREVESCTTKYKDEPVYDDKCSYQVDRWTESRKVKSNGQTLGALNWPQTAISRTGQCIGCEREGGHQERYEVRFRDADKDEKSCTFPETRWSTFAVGKRYHAESRVIGGSLDCDSLRE